MKSTIFRLVLMLALAGLIWPQMQMSTWLNGIAIGLLAADLGRQVVKHLGGRA